MKRANPGLNESNPFRIEAWIIRRIETQIILIPLKTARNRVPLHNGFAHPDYFKVMDRVAPALT